MKPNFPLAAMALSVAGCAVAPLPDGSHISRLPADRMAQVAPVVSPEERERLKRLDAQVQAEQEQAARQEAWMLQMERARLQWELDGGVGWYPDPWPWGPPYRRRWDGWRAGIWGPWPY
jgi:hypothetical protein